MSQEPRSGSWWLTLPGVLTGVAAVITAVTGLAIGLHQISAPSGPEKASSPEKPAADTTQQSLALPAGREVKFPLAPGCEGELVYKILSARLEPYNWDKRTLRVSV